MAMEGGKLTLSFLLPLKAPAAQGRGVTAVEVYDPTFFVSFTWPRGRTPPASSARRRVAPPP